MMRNEEDDDQRHKGEDDVAQVARGSGHVCVCVGDSEEEVVVRGGLSGAPMRVFPKGCTLPLRQPLPGYSRR